MAFVKCDKCGNEIIIYRSDETEATAEKYGLEVVAKLPIDPELANDADEGQIENYKAGALSKLVEKISL